jgi:hypothetical protein
MMYANSRDIVSGFGVVWTPLVVVVVSMILLMLLLWLIWREWAKVALLSCILLVSVVSYGQLLPIDPAVYPPLLHRTLLPLWLIFILCGFLIVLLRTKPGGRRRLSVIGNVISVGILIVVTVNLTVFGGGGKAFEHQEYEVGEMAGLPDIYYIVPDEYGSARILEEYYGYDDGELVSFLRGKGFYVDPGAFTNYGDTTYSLASSMNLNYLDPQKNSTYIEMIRENDVVRTLRTAGYRYVHVGSWFDTTATNCSADVNYNSSFGEFPWALYKSTLFYAVGAGVFGTGEEDYCRGHTKGQIEYLIEGWEEDNDPNKPTFTFVHLLCPHRPFVYNTDGSEVTERQRKSWGDNEGYINQVGYMGRQLERIAEEILGRPGPTPIILLQADEGPSPAKWFEYGEEKESYDNVAVDEPEVTRAKYGGLLACLIPGADGDSLANLHSPVNVFRVVFNTLFDTHLDLLPDRHFVSVDLEITGEVWD